MCTLQIQPIFANDENQNVSNDNPSYTCEVQVSEPMTKDEMATQYAQENDVTFDEAYLILYPDQYQVQNLQYMVSDTTREIYITLNVDSNYKPKLAFFCYTSEAGGYWGILSIYHVTLYRAYNGNSKGFSGEINAWLRSPYQIEYLVNGDFYNNSTTTSGGSIGGNFGIDDFISLNASASFTSSTNHYSYFYDHQTASFQS
jgi:hypothetical protein